jgi:hypothetical protein
MALRIASLLLAISPALIKSQDFIVGSSDSGVCIGSYCCEGSLIGGTGNSNDASDFTCCLGDPNHGIINGAPDATCTAGSAVPLTAATGSGAASATRISNSANSATASPSSDDFSNDDSSDSSTSINDDASAATATASGAMISSTTSQHNTASSSSTPTPSVSNSASSSSNSTSASATGNAAVGGYQFSAGQAAVGLLALGYNIAL